MGFIEQKERNEFFYKDIINHSSIKFESFDELNKQQAKEYFEWYIEQKGDRLGLLQKILSDSCSGIVLDYSSKTMVDIWKWYEGRISLDEKNEFKLESEKKRYPDWLKG